MKDNKGPPPTPKCGVTGPSGSSMMAARLYLNFAAARTRTGPEPLLQNPNEPKIDGKRSLNSAVSAPILTEKY